MFRHTSAALAVGEVIGVFPERMSHTEPRNVQVKDGVTWATVEYAKARVCPGRTARSWSLSPQR
ncbi:hypothetical protein P692DRAFT_20828667 [Suillus brevipes Sb2]|jgi:glycerol-3-phosphate O-acyltransferase/dihydroxyacetone phosphate acyltransferase|nr:hypothetical protein P692DRAFT_20828667 [Suillus brevipes Sb2]